jgi:YVTN family beta-propeller protein
LTGAANYYKDLLVAYRMIDSFINLTIKEEYPEFAGIGSHPHGTAIKATTNILYVTNTVSVIHANTRIYVVNMGSESVSVIDGTTNAIVGTVKVGYSRRCY